MENVTITPGWVELSHDYLYMYTLIIKDIIDRIFTIWPHLLGLCKNQFLDIIQLITNNWWGQAKESYLHYRPEKAICTTDQRKLFALQTRESYLHYRPEKAICITEQRKLFALQAEKAICTTGQRKLFALQARESYLHYRPEKAICTMLKCFHSAAQLAVSVWPTVLFRLY